MEVERGIKIPREIADIFDVTPDINYRRYGFPGHQIPSDGQNFLLYSPSVNLSTFDSAHLESWLFYSPPERLFLDFVRLPPEYRFIDSIRAVLGQEHIRDLNRYTHNQHSLCKLPVEVLERMFEYLSLHETIRLGLTCVFLWEVSHRHLANLQPAAIGQLAGERLILVGDHLGDRFYPDSIELNEDNIPPTPSLPLNMWNFAECSFSGIPRALNETFYWIGEDSQTYNEFNKLSAKLRSCFATGSRPIWRWMAQLIERDDWILRNLTRHEYIRKSVLDGPRREWGEDLCRIYPVNFVSVLLYHVCFGAETGLNFGYEGNIQWGEWPCNRFDFVTLSHHKQEATDHTEDWVDRTSDATEEMADIWKTQKAHMETWLDPALA